MFDDDLRLRARRLAAGEFRQDDLTHLYLGLRDQHHGRQAFREMGDFVAHRKERVKGLLHSVGQDVLTAFTVCTTSMSGVKPPLDERIEAARANLRMATDPQIRRLLGYRRMEAETRLERVVAHLKARTAVTSGHDQRVWDRLWNNFIWRPAFSADALYAEFRFMLHRNGILEKSELAAFDKAKTFITLHAAKTMHGSQIRMKTGQTANLYAGYANTERVLEVKVELMHMQMGKPVIAPVSLFLTNLKGVDHAEPDLHLVSSEADYKVWATSLDLTPDMKIGLPR